MFRTFGVIFHGDGQTSEVFDLVEFGGEGHMHGV